MNFRQHAVSVSLLLMLCSPLALLGSTYTFRSSNESDPVTIRMAKIDYFAFGGVGFGLQISPGETDYRNILARPSAAADFESIFAIGTPQAKCYALAGLRQVNPKRFESLAATFQSSGRKVMVMRGCILSYEPIAEVVSRIRSGVYSGPITHDIVPPPATTQKLPDSRSRPDKEASWINRLREFFSPLAPTLPDPPPPPPGLPLPLFSSHSH